MLLAQAAMELRLALRQGEQVLVTLIIPVLLTLLLVLGSLVKTDGSSRADYFMPGILALAIMSSAFTGLAITTGFERKYGVLKRLGATAMPRSVLLGGKTLAVLAFVAVQLTALGVLGLLLGWQPQGGVVGAVLIVLLGTGAFAALGLLMAGTLRAEATLAAANLVWFLLLLGGGMLLPLTRLSDSAASLLQFLPSAALADGLRASFQDGFGAPIGAGPHPARLVHGRFCRRGPVVPLGVSSCGHGVGTADLDLDPSDLPSTVLTRWRLGRSAACRKTNRRTRPISVVHTAAGPRGGVWLRLPV